MYDLCHRRQPCRELPAEKPGAAAPGIPQEGSQTEEDHMPKLEEDPIGLSLLDAVNRSEHGQQYNLETLEKAFGVAAKNHNGQLRRSGEAYVTHPVAVAAILIDLGMDTDCIAAALLHDVVEDTKVSIGEVQAAFGADVANLVDGVTKLGKIPYIDKEEEQVENLRKMFMATARDIRVIIIKLADRLHNMRTMDVMPEIKQREKSRETMEVYAPLAHRLGIQQFKVELEDLSLRYLDPIGYDEIVHEFASGRPERQRFLDDTMRRIQGRVEAAIPDVQVQGRIKHVYSVYQKMFRQNKTLGEILDLYAIRIIVDTILECYYALSIVHELYKPLPNTFKDYIAAPKPNMYQSLHTTVMGTQGFPFEVQIRTREMHRTAEFGIAAHWKYKRGLSRKDSLDGKLEWVRQVLEVQQTSSDPEEFMRTFKMDFFDDEVFVFTPRGDLINLPAGATAIDFAYAIHSEVGHKMVGAKANGKQVTLDYKVKNGDIVEVVTTKESNKGPSRDWLGIVATGEAKSKIRQWFKREKREENILRGREEIGHLLRQNLIVMEPAELEELLGTIARRLGITGVEELYASVGYGGISANRVVGKVRDSYARTHKPTDEDVLEQLSEQVAKPKKASKDGIIVEGLEGCLVKFARCCNPLPGDDIVGFVTKGFGVSVHRRDCKNFQSAVVQDRDLGRWVAVYWDDDGKTSYQTELQVFATLRENLLADIMICLSGLKVPVSSLKIREAGKGGGALVTALVEVKDLEHLSLIINKVTHVKGIFEVKRVKATG